MIFLALFLECVLLFVAYFSILFIYLFLLKADVFCRAMETEIKW